MSVYFLYGKVPEIAEPPGSFDEPLASYDYRLHPIKIEVVGEVFIFPLTCRMS